MISWQDWFEFNHLFKPEEAVFSNLEDTEIHKLSIIHKSNSIIYNYHANK